MGGFLPLGQITRMWRGSDEIHALYHGGNVIWTKPAPALPISTYYGVGVGQIPTDYNPALANYHASSGALTSMPNQGGAGSLFDATKAGSGDITRPAGTDLLSYLGSNWIAPTNDPDLMGTRTFFVVDLVLAERLTYIFGRQISGNVGATNVRLDTLTETIRVMRHTGSAWENPTDLSWPGIGAGFHLIEFEIIAGGNIRFFVDGALISTVATRAGWTDYRINRIGRGQGSPGVAGSIGRIVTLITDGSSAYHTQIAAIRSGLRQQYPGLP